MAASRVGVRGSTQRACEAGRGMCVNMTAGETAGYWQHGMQSSAGVETLILSKRSNTQMKFEDDGENLREDQ